jgi:hypothetical protein
LIKDSKPPLFPIIKHSPFKRPTFDKEGQQESFDKPKALFYYFKNSQVVADPFIALALFFSPFGIKHQNGINLGPLTPLPHQNLQLKAIRIQR